MEFLEWEIVVMECACRYTNVVRISAIIVGDVCVMYIRGLYGWIVASAPDEEATEERFHKESEEERGKDIPL